MARGHPPRPINGNRYGRLVAVSLVGRDKHREGIWLCKCDCGNETTVARGNLRSGGTQSCGCFHDEAARLSRRKHGATSGYFKSATYRCWVAIKKRCSATKVGSKDYRLYASRGISVCQRWVDSYEAFLEDMGERPSSKHSIDRINNDGNYEPGNCRWATAHQQSRNKRGIRFVDAFGRRLILSDWAAESGIAASTIRKRLRAGVPAEVAVGATGAIYTKPIGRPPRKPQVPANDREKVEA